MTRWLDDEVLAPLLRPLVAVVEHIDSQVAGLDKEIAARAKASTACKRLMTVPGVGPLVALTYAAGVDDPARFSDSRTVGAHFLSWQTIMETLIDSKPPPMSKPRSPGELIRDRRQLELLTPVTAACSLFG